MSSDLGPFRPLKTRQLLEKLTRDVETVKEELPKRAPSAEERAMQIQLEDLLKVANSAKNDLRPDGDEFDSRVKHIVDGVEALKLSTAEGTHNCETVAKQLKQWKEELTDTSMHAYAKASHRRVLAELAGSTDYFKMKRVKLVLGKTQTFRARNVERLIGPQFTNDLKRVIEHLKELTSQLEIVDRWHELQGWPTHRRADLTDPIVDKAHELQLELIAHPTHQSAHTAKELLKDIDESVNGYVATIALIDNRFSGMAYWGDSARWEGGHNDGHSIEESIGRRMRKIYFPTRAQLIRRA